MSKHTLGPWSYIGAKDASGDVGIKAPSKSNIIAECFADMDYDGEHAREEAAANARLISAAPDLLEALKGLIRRYDAENPGAAMEPDGGCIECTVGTVPNNMNTGLCPMHKAIAAIAKAEGQ